jgi:hypothetical protein
MDRLILLLESDDRSRIRKVHFTQREIYAMTALCFRPSTYATLMDSGVIVCSTFALRGKVLDLPRLVEWDNPI